MFETRSETKRPPFLKFLPVAAGIAAVVGLGIFFFLSRGPEPVQELTGVLHEGDPQFESYRDQLAVVDEEIEMGLNFARKRIVMVGGVIENRGEQSIDVVEVRVSFFNYDELVAETIRVPLRPGPYTPPIPPRSSRAFGFYVEEIPEDWMSSHAELSLHGFRFHESSS